MLFMEASQKNIDIVNKIIDLLEDEQVTIYDALAILKYAGDRIQNTSNVTKAEHIIINQKRI